MRLSIIIPVYKVEAYILSCLKSIIEQYEDSYEIILVDDGSPDRSIELARGFLQEQKNLQWRILEPGHQGVAQARNDGLKVARGEYVWFIDSDDCIALNALNVIFSYLDCKPEILAFRAAELIDGKIGRIRQAEYSNKEMSGEEFILRQDWKSTVWSYVFNREFLQSRDLNFYPGIYHEDVEFIPRALCEASRLVAVNDVLYYITPNPISVTRSFNPQKSFDMVVVASRLSEYCANLNPALQDKLNLSICTCLLHALNPSALFDLQTCKKLDRHFYVYRKLFSQLRRSQYYSIKLEGILLTLFPRRACRIHSLLRTVLRK